MAVLFFFPEEQEEFVKLPHNLFVANYVSKKTEKKCPTTGHDCDGGRSFSPIDLLHPDYHQFP